MVNGSFFFEDECHLLWKNICGYAWGLKQQVLQAPIINEKQRQTYYGVLNMMTGEVILKALPKGDSTNTITFLTFLQDRFPDKKITLIWDGASYHCSQQLRTYLQSVNGSLAAQDWKLTCIKFAPYAPEQNPIETIWGKAKSVLRQNYHQFPSFANVKKLFVNSIENIFFSFQDILDYKNIIHII